MTGMKEEPHLQVAEPQGVDVAGVTGWLIDNIPGVVPPLAFDLIPGGHSNLTYHVIDAGGGDYVLRRPPLHHVLPTAHDMGREHRVISALGPTPVPVPPALAYCPDPSVSGAPFYVMAFVEGDVLHDADTALRILDDGGRRATGLSFIDVLADLHAVDPDAVGLSDFARKDGYVARQLKRWYAQWTQSQTRPLPAVDRVHEELAARIPDQGPASIVHGDYRLGNCLSKGGHIQAVLDWEICTLGDPLADVGYVLASWPTASDSHVGDSNVPSMAPGFPEKEELLARYAARSGRDLSLIDYYVAFSYWKSACIVEGVYARYLGGALGETALDLDAFRVRVERAAAQAEVAVARLG